MLKYKTQVSHRIESALSRIHPPEFESVVGRSQPQLASSLRNSTQPCDGVSCNSYSSVGSRHHHPCQKFSVKLKVKYFLTVHYFVFVMSTFPYCQYINVSVAIIVEYSRQFTVLYNLYIYIYI